VFEPLEIAGGEAYGFSVARPLESGPARLQVEMVNGRTTSCERYSMMNLNEHMSTLKNLLKANRVDAEIFEYHIWTAVTGLLEVSEQIRIDVFYSLHQFCAYIKNSALTQTDNKPKSKFVRFQYSAAPFSMRCSAAASNSTAFCSVDCILFKASDDFKSNAADK